MTDAPINRRSMGLLSLLDLKTMGETPRNLGKLVQPTMELFDFYLIDSEIQNAQLTRTINANVTEGTFLQLSGFSTNLGGNTVPNDEVWYVREWCLISRFANIAGQTMEPWFCWQQAGAGITQIPAQDALNGATASTASFNAERYNWGQRELWLPPGALFGVIGSVPFNVNANSITFSWNARVTRLRA